MTDSMEEILNEDSVKGAINELCEDMKDFGELDFVHILWCKRGGLPKGRYYGELDTILSNLVKAQFLLLTTHGAGEIER